MQFHAEEERDPTHTDTLWTKYTIKVRGFVSDTSQFRNDSAQTARDIRGKLQSPRKRFVYKIGDVTLVEVDATGASPVPLDCKIGPEPMPTTVTEVTSGTFWVETGVVVRICETQSNCTQNPVVSLRWTQSESFDENWYSHVNTSGKLIVRSDLLQNADNFRSLCTPPLLRDYKRLSAKYTLSPDGLELDFAFEDQEFDRLPPFPATKASGRFSVTVQQNGGAKRVGECTVVLEGPKGTSRKNLMLRALSMAYSKLLAENHLATKVFGLTSVMNFFWGKLEEDLFEPKVTVTVAALLPPLGSGGAGFIGGDLLSVINNTANAITGNTPPPVAMASVGLPPAGVGENFPPLAPPVRKRLAGLLAAAFKDPCACAAAEVDLTATRTSSPPTSGTTIVDLTTAGTVPPASISVGLTTTGTPFVTDMNPYDIFKTQVTLKTDSGTIQLPGTGVGSPSSGDIANLVTVAGKVTTMMVAWVVGRTGIPPVLPTYETGNPNIVPLQGVITANNVELSSDATGYIYMAAGYYLYGVLNPAKAELTAGTPPYLGSTAATAAGEVGANFSTNILQDKPGQGATNANPFVPNGVKPDVPPQNDAQELGFQNLPVAGMAGLGGFINIPGTTPSGQGNPVNPEFPNDPFFNAPFSAPTVGP